MEPGAVGSAVFGFCVTKYANFPPRLKINVSLPLALPFMDVAPDGITAPEVEAIENDCTEFPPYRYRNLCEGSVSIPAGMKLVSSNGEVTPVGVNAPVVLSIVSIVSELPPVCCGDKTYANCDEAFAAGPMAKNVEGVADFVDDPELAVMVAVVVAELTPAVSSVTVRVTVQVQALE